MCMNIFYTNAKIYVHMDKMLASDTNSLCLWGIVSLIFSLALVTSSGKNFLLLLRVPVQYILFATKGELL